MTSILLWSSAVRVHDSQAHSKMDVTRETRQADQKSVKHCFREKNRISFLRVADVGTPERA